MSPSHKLTRDQRVRKRKLFLKIQNKGRKFYSDHFVLSVGKQNPSADPAKSRLGITVTTKVHKHAVQRNRLKRQVREFMRRTWERFTGTADLVVIARSGATGLKTTDVAAELSALLRKARLLPNE